jgi:branched-chain amino acid transport system ATP-binding protein
MPLEDLAMTALLGTSLGVFIGFTLIITGGAAIMTGRALADGWQKAWLVVAACFGLALADRFLVYALFQGELLHLAGFVIHFLAITALALLAHRITAVRKMVTQYPWRYERSSLFAYREKPAQL